MYALPVPSSTGEMQIVRGEMALLTCGESGYWQLGSCWCKKPWRRLWICIVITGYFLPMIPETFPGSCWVCRLVSYQTKLPKEVVEAPSSEIIKILLDTVLCNLTLVHPPSSHATVGNVQCYCFNNKNRWSIGSINLVTLLATQTISKKSTVRLRRNKPLFTELFSTQITGTMWKYWVYDMLIKIDQIPPPAPSHNLVLLFADCELEETWSSVANDDIYLGR